MISSAPLDPIRHVLDGFDSGESELDTWLTRHAAGSDAGGITRTFVWTEPHSTVVVGYYCLTAHILIRDALPTSLGPGRPTQIPATLLAKLALDRRLHGSGCGAALLGDAMERAARASLNVGARFLVVDALHDQAVSFYEHFGFRRIPGTLRLVQKLTSIVQAIEQA